MNRLPVVLNAAKPLSLRDPRTALTSFATVATLAALAVLATASSQAGAQQLYKWVGPDGKVTYSDTAPPSTAKQIERKPITVGNAGGGDLPFELREAVKINPVTLYAGPNCVPCDAGRALLTTRGIPFSEKTVTTNNDMAKLREIGGDLRMPLLVVGRSRQSGYEESTWADALTQAGYPETSRLPKTYRPQPAQAAAPLPPAKPLAPADSEQTAAIPTRSDPAPISNAPPGFRF